MSTAMSGVTLFKSQEDFYRRNKATMKTSRALTEEAERGAVDLRYAYKLLPPGSKNFYAKAWEQTWGGDALMYNAKRVDSKRPVIEKINLDQPETGSLPTNAPKNGLGSEGIICDTLVGDSPDYIRTALFSRLLRNPISDENDDEDEEHPDDDSVEGGEEGKEEDSLPASAVALVDGDAATGEAAWGPAPGDNASAFSGRGGGGSAASRATPASARSGGGSAASRATPASARSGGGSAASRATSVSARSSVRSGGGARSVGGLSKGTSSGESYQSDEGPGGPPAARSASKAESDPRAGGGGASAAAAAAAPAKAKNIPKATAYPAANALAKKVRAAKGAPPEGMAAELKAMPRREQNRFHKWAKASGYE